MLNGHMHGPEFRRCLLEMDVPALKRLWEHVAPELAAQPIDDLITSMHMARVEMKSAPAKVKFYSKAWLLERGIKRVDGRWIKGDPQPLGIVDAVGIAVKSRYPEARTYIHDHMQGALLNVMAKGERDPSRQRSVILKARDKARFKLGMA